jgi:hypothetical protein
MLEDGMKQPRLVKRLVVTRGAAKDPTPRPPQAWELAPKQAVSADKLVRDHNDTIGRFFLNLALAFNDLKGLVMFEQYLIAMGRPAVADFGPHFGQWHGTNTQIHRWIAAVLHEVMNTIGASQFKSVLSGKELRGLVAALPPAQRTSWDTLVTVATAPLNKPGMTSLLMRIRNEAGFHYGYKGIELAKSYRALYCDEAKKNPNGANEAAQYSVANDMDGTRFYFADGAAQHLMQSRLASNSATIEEIFNLANDVNVALANLIGRFIESRDA